MNGAGDNLRAAMRIAQKGPGKGLEKGIERSGPVVIAEIAQAHDGSLGAAHAYVDAVADAGADAVKFQTHIANAESTRDEPWRIKFSPVDETRYEYWQRMEFTHEEWAGLQRHSVEQNLFFLSSPFSMEALEMLLQVGVAAWKVASGEVTNLPLLERMSETPIPVLLSTGMATIGEIDAAAHLLREKDALGGVMQCTTSYPTRPETVGLNMLSVFRERYDCSVGLSDHSGTIYPSLAAASFGADVLEVHVTFSRHSFGPDVTSSVTIEEFADLCRGVRFVDEMARSPIDKNVMASELEPLRRLFAKSLVYAVDLKKGDRLEPSHVRLKKPGTGLPSTQLERFVGCILRHDVSSDAQLSESDFDQSAK